MQSEVVLQRVEKLSADFFSGRQSSIEGDSSEDIEDDSSTEGGELEEHLRWPPELLIAPTTRRRSRRRSDNIEEQNCEVRDGDRREGTRSAWTGKGSETGWAGEGVGLQRAPG
jgi:hypothetical protein